jgi:hypothetical protein
MRKALEVFIKSVIWFLPISFGGLILAIAWLTNWVAGVIVLAVLVGVVAFKLRRHKKDVSANQVDTLKTVVFKAVVAVMVLLACLPGFAIGKFTIDCQLGHRRSVSDARARIDGFNKVQPAPSLPSQEANVSEDGDCVDSQPYITVTKKYTVNKDGGALLDEVRDSLSTQGYEISNEEFNNNGCGYRYYVHFTQGDITFSLQLMQSSYNNASCVNIYNRDTVTEEQFRNAHIDELNMTLL